MKTNLLQKVYFLVTVFFSTFSVFGQTVLHVDDNAGAGGTGSAIAPYQTIQAAIQAAVNDDTIKVAAGTYTENVLVQNQSVILLGGFPGGSAADYGGGAGGDFSARNSQAYVSHINGGGLETTVALVNAGASIVDGFRITGGTRSQFGLPYFNQGGGFYCYGGNLTITNNLIEKNDSRDSELPVSETSGGGIYAEDCDITIRGNMIRNNASGAGAGIAVLNSTVIIESNLIENNIGYNDHGGGLYVSCPNTTIRRNTIRNNEIGRDLGYGWGGGLIFFGLNSKAELSFNVVTNNLAPTAGSGMFIDDGAAATLVHELIYGNRCSEIGGTGIYVDGEGEGYPGEAGSTVTITNCTVADNQTCSGEEIGNGLLIERNSTVTITNSIFWGNGDDFSADPTSTLSVTYSNSAESVSGTENSNTDPFFANPVARDFHLSSKAGRWDISTQTWVTDTTDSPCIDAGDPSVDYSNEPIPNGKRINLGAYGNTSEASKSTASTSVNETTTIDQFELMQNYPNPVNPQTRIVYQVSKSGHVSLTIFNLLGQEVRALVDELQPTGTFNAVWDGKDNWGELVVSGSYVYKLQLDGRVIQTRKMVLLR